MYSLGASVLATGHSWLRSILDSYPCIGSHSFTYQQMCARLQPSHFVCARTVVVRSIACACGALKPKKKFGRFRARKAAGKVHAPQRQAVREQLRHEQ